MKRNIVGLVLLLLVAAPVWASTNDISQVPVQPGTNEITLETRVSQLRGLLATNPREVTTDTIQLLAKVQLLSALDRGESKEALELSQVLLTLQMVKYNTVNTEILCQFKPQLDTLPAFVKRVARSVAQEDGRALTIGIVTRWLVATNSSQAIEATK